MDDQDAHRAERRVAASKGRDSKPQELRTEAQRDRDRILYSYEFRRLAHVTQVVSESETQLFHSRLTHSLKVAQIARRMAERLLRMTDPATVRAAGGLEADVAESAALAHDLGHPPFGHMAEKQLQKLVKSKDYPGSSAPDSFEGNAQTFRIVCKLAFRSTREGEPALNLTRATLNGILKYPWMFGEHPKPRYEDKWGAYKSEASDFKFARDGVTHAEQSLEAEIMDFADDVSYSVHDVEDFFRAGMIPLDRMRAGGAEADSFLDYVIHQLAREGDPEDTFTKEECETAFEQVSSYAFLSEPYDGSRQHREALNKVASDLLTIFLAPVTISEVGRLNIPRTVRSQVAVLKQLTWRYVIDNPALAMTQEGQRNVITTLYEILCDLVNQAAAKPSMEVRLPRLLREQLGAVRTDQEALAEYEADDEVLRTRAVIDYISSLTERQAVDLFRRTTGSGFALSALEPWLTA